jgi:elongation factor Ts
MKLRKMTGAGMMDCKKALQEAEGDFERAKDIIREKGKLVVSKRADRSASEGVVVTKIVGQKAYLLCLACETDFVAQNSEFSASANQILEIAVANDAADVEALKAIKNAEGITVEEMVTEKSGQTGEKVELAYYGRIEAPYCSAYVHFNKKLGTILGFNKEVSEEVAHAIAMQATAMAPISIDENDCPAEVVEKEKAIALEMMKQDPKNANKPEAILAKIAEGKMRKFFEENTLLNQAVVGEKYSIREFLQQADKEATVIAYKRFALEA